MDSKLLHNFSLFSFCLLCLFASSFSSFAAEKLSEINIEDFVKIQKEPENKEVKDPFMKSKKVFSDNELHLFGIINGKERSGCLINDKILFINDTIGDYKVIHINKQRVLLKGASGNLELAL